MKIAPLVLKGFGAALSALILTLVLSLLPGQSTPQAQATQPQMAATATTVSPYTLVIGDSLTYYGRDALKARRPGWIVDGHRGRKVSLIPDRIMFWTAKKGAQPSLLVVALGSNDVRYWIPSDYRMVQKMLPQTKIVFVTPFRDDKVFGWDRRVTMYRYAQSMRTLAKHSARVCVADWAARVRRDPDKFLRDGVHQTKYGIRMWSWLISTRAANCG